MYCDVPEAAYHLGYAYPASLYRLLKAGLLKEHVEMHYGQVLRVNLQLLQSVLDRWLTSEAGMKSLCLNLQKRNLYREAVIDITKKP